MTDAMQPKIKCVSINKIFHSFPLTCYYLYSVIRAYSLLVNNFCFLSGIQNSLWFQTYSAFPRTFF